jgi:hypothetical protein
MLRVFSDACHRHGWLPGLSHGAVIYVEELPFHHDEVARFIPEFVMAQLESAAALDRLPFTTTRNLVMVLMETGLRGGDACGLAFSPTLDDSAGWPCLRFEATKVRAEQLIPLSAKAAAAIRSQQEHVRQQWPAGSPWLFPGITGNDDGAKAYSHRTFAQQLTHWQRVIDLRDQAGQPATVTGHQFRHTLGTRLINSGVPQHVVQKLLGHYADDAVKSRMDVRPGSCCGAGGGGRLSSVPGCSRGRRPGGGARLPGGRRVSRSGGRAGLRDAEQALDGGHEEAPAAGALEAFWREPVRSVTQCCSHRACQLRLRYRRAAVDGDRLSSRPMPAQVCP